MAGARNVFISGGTGYLGQPLISCLRERGHTVRALVRVGSERKVPAGCDVVFGDALDAGTFADAVAPADTLVHLVGTPHPNPAKAQAFQRVDLASGKAAAAAAVRAGVSHFVYVSVAQPAPMMKAYVQARCACEEAIRAAGLNATILRPWYVLGPGHRWPYALLPLYWLAGQIPSTRVAAQRLGLVTREQMVAALLRAVEQPATGVQVVEVPAIRMATPAPRAQAARVQAN